MNRRRINFFLFYAATASLIALYMGQAKWLTYYRLTKDGTVTQAQVTQTTCADHSTFSYRFAVNGQTFDGKGGDGNGNPPCKALQSGDQVKVVYLASAPRTNLPGDPRERLGNETAVIGTAALVGPLVFLFILFLIIRRRQA